MLKRNLPLEKKYLSLTDSETESDEDVRELYLNLKSSNPFTKFRRGIFIGKGRLQFKRNIKQYAGKSSDHDSGALAMRKKAEKYQEKMKQIPIPTNGNSKDMSFKTWQELAECMKEKYEQPFHYLTHKLLLELDQSTENKKQPLMRIIDPANAETTIWAIEQSHRLCSSPDFLAKLWLSDPLHHLFI